MPLFLMQSGWQDSFDRQYAHLDATQWLTKAYVLSAAIKRVCTDFALNVLHEGLEETPLKDECAFTSGPCWIREINLTGEGIPMSFGRVVVPDVTYRHFQSQFDTLGTKLIGEHFLYAKAAARSPFEFALLDASMPLYQRVSHYFPNTDFPNQLWARRSVFHLGEYPLLVSDVLLPAIPLYVDA